jgi:hypothetical protein
MSVRFVGPTDCLSLCCRSFAWAIGPDGSAASWESLSDLALSLLCWIPI